MRAEEAKEKTCPYLSDKCIIEDCMFWETTVKGKAGGENPSRTKRDFIPL